VKSRRERGAADRGEYREAAGVFAEAVKRAAEGGLGQQELETQIT
jgi:hypothetical protein